MATTSRQKQLVRHISANLGQSLGKAMREVGYSKEYANNSQQLTRSQSWQKLMEKFLPDQKLLQVHKELLDNPDWHARNEGLDKAYRIKGRLGSSSQSGLDTTSQEIREVIFRIRNILPAEGN